MLCTKPWVMLMTQRFVCRPQEAGQSLEGRVSAAMHHAGVAITITSVTDFIAFAIGASSSLPILRFFLTLSVCLPWKSIYNKITFDFGSAQKTFLRATLLQPLYHIYDLTGLYTGCTLLQVLLPVCRGGGPGHLLPTGIVNSTVLIGFTVYRVWARDSRDNDNETTR